MILGIRSKRLGSQTEERKAKTKACFLHQQSRKQGLILLQPPKIVQNPFQNYLYEGQETKVFYPSSRPIILGLCLGPLIHTPKLCLHIGQEDAWCYKRPWDRNYETLSKR